MNETMQCVAGVLHLGNISFIPVEAGDSDPNADVKIDDGVLLHDNPCTLIDCLASHS